MENKFIFLFLSFKELSIDSELNNITNNFSLRKKFQKIVYILQEMYNTPLEYRYNLYIYGPYSPHLTKDLFSMNDSYRRVVEAANRYGLKESTRTKLKRIQEEILNRTPEGLEEADWIELISTYHYVNKNVFVGDSDNCKKYIYDNKNHLVEHLETAIKVITDIV